MSVVPKNSNSGSRQMGPTKQKVKKDGRTGSAQGKHQTTTNPSDANKNNARATYRFFELKTNYTVYL